MPFPPDAVGDGQASAPQTLLCGGKRGCGKLKLVDQFTVRNEKPLSLCRDCELTAGREYVRAHRIADPEAVRRMNLWRLYRMRVEDYDRMRIEQDYRCAVCGIHESNITSRASRGRPRGDGTVTPAALLHVDHCHKTGSVRGLLCSPCNRILGIADDKAEVLNACVAYLQKYPSPDAA